MIAGSIDPNCCWGGKDNVDACNRQGACNVGGDTDNYCAKFGITPAQCVSLSTSSWLALERSIFLMQSLILLSCYRMLIVAIRGPGRGSLALRAGMLVIARRVALIGFEFGVLKRRFL